MCLGVGTYHKRTKISLVCTSFGASTVFKWQYTSVAEIWLIRYISEVISEESLSILWEGQTKRTKQCHPNDECVFCTGSECKMKAQEALIERHIAIAAQDVGAGVLRSPEMGSRAGNHPFRGIISSFPTQAPRTGGPGQGGWHPNPLPPARSRRWRILQMSLWPTWRRLSSVRLPARSTMGFSLTARLLLAGCSSGCS